MRSCLGDGQLRDWAVFVYEGRGGCWFKWRQAIAPIVCVQPLHKCEREDWCCICLCPALLCEQHCWMNIYIFSLPENVYWLFRVCANWWLICTNACNLICHFCTKMWSWATKPFICVFFYWDLYLKSEYISFPVM